MNPIQHRPLGTHIGSLFCLGLGLLVAQTQGAQTDPSGLSNALKKVPAAPIFLREPDVLAPGIVRSAPSVQAPAGYAVPNGRVGPLAPGLQPVQHTVTLKALSALQRQQLEQEDAFEATTHSQGRLRVGIGRPFEEPLTVESQTGVGWFMLSNGWRICSILVTSPGAVGLRVHLEQIELPTGVRVLAYSPEQLIPETPITDKMLAGQTEIWTPTTFGERVVLECQAPPGADIGSVRFKLTAVSHLYRQLDAVVEPQAFVCENDVSCYPAWGSPAAGVGRMYFIDNGSEYLCTGALLNTSPSSYVNYFLTANHCIGDPTVASTLEVYWFFQTTSCHGQVPTLDSLPASQGGADFLAGSSANDFTLLRLHQAAPAGATFLGWTTAAPAMGGTAVGIHHPGLPPGDYKRISFANLTSFDADFLYVQWTSGTTEPGSSGSPLLNASQQVLGQLWGGNAVCPPNGLSQYGRFDVTYPAISSWLELAAQNDVCSGALPLTDNVYHTQYTGHATDDATPCAGSISAGVWFTFTPAATGTATVDTCPSDFDTVLEAFSGSCGSLNSLGCNDDACGYQSTLSFPCRAGATYHLCAGGFGGASGNLQIRAHVLWKHLALTGDLGFGSLPAGQTATRTLRLSNTGNTTLTVSQITYPDGFTGAWTGQIAPGGSQDIPVLFAPVAQAAYGGNLVISSDVDTGARTAAITGSGYFPLTNTWTLWWQHTNGSLAIWTMNGTNAVQSAHLSPPSSGPAWRVVGVGDFNQDSQPDLLFRSAEGALAAWLMNGSVRQSSGSLTPSQVDTNWQVMATADFDNDGQKDIVWQRNGALAIWLMHGLVSTQTLHFNPAWVDPSWRLAAAADFNGDSQPDLLWQNLEGRLAVWFMSGTNRIGTAHLSPGSVDPHWRMGAVSDFNADGHPGLVWQHSSGALAYWQMAGTNCVHSGRLNPGLVDPDWMIVGPR